jgi:FAD synthase
VRNNMIFDSIDDLQAHIIKDKENIQKYFG